MGYHEVEGSWNTESHIWEVAVGRGQVQRVGILLLSILDGSVPVQVALVVEEEVLCMF